MQSQVRWKKKKIKERELSLYPCLDFLEGPLKSPGIKENCAGASERFRLCQCLPNCELGGCWRQLAGFYGY